MAEAAAEKALNFSNKAVEAAPTSEAAASAKVSAKEAAEAAKIARKAADVKAEWEAFFSDNARLFSIGASAGSSFTAPWLTGTLQGTVSVLKNTFFDIGCDLGVIHGYKGWEDISYYSLYPFAHLNGFVPFGGHGGWYAGIGGGYMMAFYTGSGEDSAFYVPTLDATTGLYLGGGRHYVTLAYSLRTTFKAVNHTVALGYSFRFE
jgi:hypothetical protein